MAPKNTEILEKFHYDTTPSTNKVLRLVLPLQFPFFNFKKAHPKNTKANFTLFSFMSFIKRENREKRQKREILNLWVGERGGGE